jgi:protease secretion system outer membrane protein
MRCIGGIGLLCWGSSIPALTLTQAYQAALLNDPFLKSDWYAAQAGREEYRLGVSGLLPEVSLNTRKMDNQGQRDTSIGQLVKNEKLGYQSLGETINIRQPLYNGGKLATYHAGKIRTEAAQSQWVSGQQNALMRVIGAYLDALNTLQGTELATAKKKTAAAQVDQIMMLMAKGEATSIDQDAARSKLALAIIQENEAIDQQMTRASVLAELTGQPVDGLPEMQFEVGDLVEQSTVASMPMSQWIDRAIEHNPDVIEKQQAAELAGIEVKKYQASYLPQVDLIASASRNNQDSFTTLNQDIRNRSVGIELNWSLYQGGYDAALIRQLHAKYEQAQQDVVAVKARTRLEVERQFRGVVTGRLKLKAIAQTIMAYRAKVHATELLQTGGVKTVIDILAAQEERLQAEKDYHDAFKDMTMARLKLSAMADLLGDDDVIVIEKSMTTGRLATTLP